MTITIGWAQIAFFILLVCSWTGFLYGIIRWLVIAKITSLETNIQQTRAEITLINTTITRLQAEMPVMYERREDSLRANTVINAKLDRLFELIAGKP